IENGSIAHGEAHSLTYLSSGASTTSFFLANALEWAILSASCAQASMPSDVRSSVAAKPQQPAASTRTPTPCDTELDTLPALPFLVETSRSVISIARASA